MPTRICQVVFDALDPKALAVFWRDLLGWRITIDRPDEVEIGSERDGDVPIGFVPTDVPKTTKNRLHLDLCRPDDFDESVGRALDLGATRIDIGQGDVKWEVLADPEGNEFCIAPTDDFSGATGAIGAIAFDAADPTLLGRFWTAATGLVLVTEGGWGVGLHAANGTGPFITLGPPVAPKRGKNRLHIDVAPPVGGSIDTEAERLIALGATRVDIGQGDVPWTVLADPEGNEFCILTPR